MTSIQQECAPVKSILKESYNPGVAICPKWYCGAWGMLNTETGKCVPFFCGSARCSRQKCKDIFWWKRIERLHVIGEYLHRPPNYPAKFFTLTYPATLSDDEAWAQWSEPWRKFRTVIARKYGSFSYGAILEKHKNNNRPHIHGITSLYMDQREWSKRWQAVGGGPVVDVRVVKDEAFADYFAKDYGLAAYFGKDNMITAFLESRRRSIFASRDVTTHEKSLLAKVGPSPWVLISEAIYRDGELDLTRGCSVVYNRRVDKYLIHFSNTKEIDHGEENPLDHNERDREAIHAGICG